MAAPITFRIVADRLAVDRYLSKLVDGIDDMRPFWVHYFAPQFFKDVQDNFASSGRYVGGWRALSPGYAAWKLAKYGRQPILVATGRMRESLTLGGRGNVVRVTKKEAQLGSTDRKLEKHQRGIGVPRRQVLFLRMGTPYTRLLNQYLRDMDKDARRTA
jgi:hypothetical protein